MMTTIRLEASTDLMTETLDFKDGKDGAECCSNLSSH